MAPLVERFQPALVFPVRAATGGGAVRPTGPWPPRCPRARLAPNPRDVGWHDRSPAVGLSPAHGRGPGSRSKALRRPPPVWPGRAPSRRVALPSAVVGQTPPGRPASRSHLPGHDSAAARRVGGLFLAMVYASLPFMPCHAVLLSFPLPPARPPLAHLPPVEHPPRRRSGGTLRFVFHGRWVQPLRGVGLGRAPNRWVRECKAESVTGTPHFCATAAASSYDAVAVIVKASLSSKARLSC